MRSKVGSEVALVLSKLFMNETYDSACKAGWPAVKGECEQAVSAFRRFISIAALFCPSQISMLSIHRRLPACTQLHLFPVRRYSFFESFNMI